jgi:threonine/homoserine/homoserine lactone efflux protein
MDTPAFAASVFALLILPGPTNAILAMASHGLTLSRMGVLLAAVILSYLAVIVPVSTVGGPFLQQHPAVSQGVKLASATWIFYLALKLWGRPSREIQSVALGVRQVVATTLLNPKAIIIALAMLPSRGILAPDVFLGFVVAAGATSWIWLSIGRVVLGDGDQMPLAARRCGCAVLLGFCVLLTVSAL